MKLRAIAFVTILTLSSLVVTFHAPDASAANGDLLMAPGAIEPINPCNIVGRAGGIAVDESTSRLYMTSRERPEIYRLSTLSPYTPCATIVPNVAVYGWNKLAFDALHPTIRFWATNNATLHGLDAAGVSQATMTFGSDVTALELDEATGHLAVVLAGQTTATLFATTPSLAPVGSLPLGYSPRALATWDGGWLVSDSSSYVRLHTPAGAVSPLGFRPGETWHEPVFFQPVRTDFAHTETAFDAASYANVGKGALWLLDETAHHVCVANCTNPQYQCVEWEGTTCIREVCVAHCSGGGGTWVTTWRPRVRAVEVVAPCAPAWAHCGPDPCAGAPWPILSVVRPTATTYARNQEIGPSSMATAAQGPLTFVVTDPSGMSGKKLNVSWNGGARTSTGAPLSFDLDTDSMPRGFHNFQVTLETLDGCRVVTDSFTLRVEHPTSWTRAQNLRVTGNIPAHIVSGTIPLEPADDLLGRETFALADRDLGASRWRALTASATHGVSSSYVSAEARTRVETSSNVLDVQALCWALVGSPECNSLPMLVVGSDDEASSSFARVDLALQSGNGGGWGYVEGAYSGTKAGGTPGYSRTSIGADHQNVYADADRSFGPRQPVSVHVPTGLADEYEAGGFKVVFAELIERNEPGVSEVLATVARITITEGPYRGEIVIGESYAGISLVGRSALSGPPTYAEVNDDFSTGGDAPSDPAAAGAPDLQPGVHSGLFRGADRADGFVVDAAPGEKLRVTLQQSHRATLLASPVPTAPTPEAAARLMRLRLYDPLGTLRDDSRIALDAHTAEVELNVDMAGAWRVLIDRTDSRLEAAPYTIAITRAPVVLLADEGAPATCGASAPAIPPAGVALGSMDASDGLDTWRFTTTATRSMLVALAPLADTEGVDFDLVLLDANCVEIATSATSDPVKGAPESIVHPPAPGTYHVQVVRFNGIGNYELLVRAV